MAKRRKSRKTGSRRRIGAMKMNADSPLIKFGGIVAGFALAAKINPMIDKVTGTTIDPKLVSAAQIGVGAAYIFIMKGKKNVPLTLVTGVLAGAGVKRAMTSFGIGNLLAGYGKVPVVGTRRLGGYKAVPVLSGGENTGYVAGYNVNPKPANVMAGADSGSGINNNDGGGYMP